MPLCLQIAFAMFGVYVLIDEKHVLDAQKVFVSMALINILKAPLSQLPFAMSTTMQVSSTYWMLTYLYFWRHFWNLTLFLVVSKFMVSLKRLGKFLCQDELELDSVESAPYHPGECISLSLFSDFPLKYNSLQADQNYYTCWAIQRFFPINVKVEF